MVDIIISFLPLCLSSLARPRRPSSSSSSSSIILFFLLFSLSLPFNKPFFFIPSISSSYILRSTRSVISTSLSPSNPPFSPFSILDTSLAFPYPPPALIPLLSIFFLPSSPQHYRQSPFTLHILACSRRDLNFETSLYLIPRYLLRFFPRP